MRASSRYACLRDDALLRTLAELLARVRTETAELLACMAEVDARRLYLPAGHASMFAYCVERLHMSEDVAYKRIQTARAARRIPVVLEMVADGRLHVSGLVLLAPYLKTENAADLLQAATHRTKAQIKEFLAGRFPQPDLPARLTPIAEAKPKGSSQLDPDPVVAPPPGSPDASSGEPAERAGARERPLAANFGNLLDPDPVHFAASPQRLEPIAPERFAMQLTIGRDTHEKLRHAQALLGHQVPSGDLATVLDMALDALIGRLEKRKFARTDRPRPRRRLSGSNPRHIPAHVKREVWKRDGGRCTFVGENGHRCEARKSLEFDHIEPVARGGQATVAGIRLRCRAHNRYEAERAFGAEFMAAKREAARRAATTRDTAPVRSAASGRAQMAAG